MWNKSFKNLCICCVLMNAAFSVTACSVLFPTEVPAPGEAHTMDTNSHDLVQCFSQNAIINQQPPPAPVNNAPV